MKSKITAAVFPVIIAKKPQRTRNNNSKGAKEKKNNNATIACFLKFSNFVLSRILFCHIDDQIIPNTPFWYFCRPY